MPKETKATDFEKEQRIDTVCELLIKGLSRSQMFRYVQTKTEWNIGIDMMDRYVVEAKEKIKNSDNDKGFEIQRAKKRLEKLYQKNENLEDYKECRALIESQARLFGWNEPEKKESEIKFTWNEVKTYEANNSPNNSP